MTLEMKMREEREEGREEGRSAIIEALKALSSGKSEEYLREKGFDEETIVMAQEYLKESGTRG